MKSTSQTTSSTNALGVVTLLLTIVEVRVTTACIVMIGEAHRDQNVQGKQIAPWEWNILRMERIRLLVWDVECARI